MEIFDRKLLLLGPESSGKSTLWFQMTMFDGHIEQRLRKMIFNFFKHQIYHHLLHMTKQSSEEPYKTLYTYSPKQLYNKILQSEKNKENNFDCIEKLPTIYKDQTLLQPEKHQEYFFE